MKVLIVGGVAGGATAAARLRRLDEKAEIVMFERGGYVSYANCGLPYYVGGVIEDREDLTLQSPQGLRAWYDLDVRVNSVVTAIDRARKRVTVKTEGKQYEESYDKLILAPGARPMVPDVPGVGLPGVFTLRTVEDALAMREFVEKKRPKRAVVVGGGFIGIETAENLLHAGVPVTLLQRRAQILPPLDADMAAELHTHLVRKGVDLRFYTPFEGVESREDGLAVLVGGQEQIECGMVVLAVGVEPDTVLARDAGLELGPKGSIVTDAHMRTSDPDIYAAGDAVVVRNFVSGRPSLIPLAGPANKQGRIAADNICGIDSEYKGTLGSTVIKVFDMTAACTGLNEKEAKAAGIAYDKTVNYCASHAGYYPGGQNMTVKTLFDPESGRIIGAQITGFEGVSKRMDVMATAIRNGLTAADLEELELCYAPPYSSAKDPVNMVGYTIENVRRGLVKQYHWNEADSLPRDGSVTILDVRSAREFAGGHIDGAVNIPLTVLRERLGELDAGKPVYVNCFSGMRSYIACRILTGSGFSCYNLSGGWRFYSAVTRGQADSGRFPCGAPKK